MGTATVRFLIPRNSEPLVEAARNGYGVIPEVMENHPQSGEVDEDWTRRETLAWLSERAGQVADFIFADCDEPDWATRELLAALVRENAVFVAFLPEWTEQSRDIYFPPEVRYSTGQGAAPSAVAWDDDPEPDDPYTWRRLSREIPASDYVQIDLILNSDLPQSIQP